VNLTFRPETPDDYYAVENLTREAFWRYGDPSQLINDVHLLAHRLRFSPSFIPELSLIAEAGGVMAGHILYSKTKIVDEHGVEHGMVKFGPLSVLPEYQGRGVGKALMRHSFEVAKGLGYRAVLIFGHPDYYPRVGFQRAAEFGVTTSDGSSFDAFMAYPLYDGALDGISGKYYYDPIFDQLTQEDALEFDKRFPPKERYVPKPICLLLDRLEPEARAAIEGLNVQSLESLGEYSERKITSLPGIDAQAIDTIYAVMKEQGRAWGTR